MVCFNFSSWAHFSNGRLWDSVASCFAEVQRCQLRSCHHHLRCRTNLLNPNTLQKNLQSWFQSPAPLLDKTSCYNILIETKLQQVGSIPFPPRAFGIVDQLFKGGCRSGECHQINHTLCPTTLSWWSGLCKMSIPRWCPSKDKEASKVPMLKGALLIVRLWQWRFLGSGSGRVWLKSLGFRLGSGIVCWGSGYLSVHFVITVRWSRNWSGLRWPSTTKPLFGPTVEILFKLN